MFLLQEMWRSRLKPHVISYNVTIPTTFLAVGRLEIPASELQRWLFGQLGGLERPGQNGAPPSAGID